MNTAISCAQLRALKIAARCSVGFVWIYEGLVPKILHVSDRQICMVQSSGWWWNSPEAKLHALGIAMIIAMPSTCKVASGDSHHQPELCTMQIWRSDTCSILGTKPS